MGNQKKTVFRYVKWVLAFLVGLGVDILDILGILQAIPEFIVTGFMIIVLIICFDVYQKEYKNILKLAYIAIITAVLTYFSIDIIFLIIFELITTDRRDK